jgi:hypothetical protein
LVALTIAKMLDPYARFNGEVINVAIGIEQVLVFTIVVSVPSQVTRDVVNVRSSLSFTVIVYVVIGKPLMSGRSQLKTTFDPSIVVVGADG